MSLNIESPHFHVSLKLQGLIESRYEHLNQVYGRIENMDVILRKPNDRQIKNNEVEIRLRVPGKVLFSLERSERFEDAISNITNDLEHQLNKYKEKWNAKN